jgi:HAD superfamily hydrolase (TIGR01509 family)
MDEAWRQIGKGGDQLIPVFVAEADRERLEPQLKAFRKEVFHRDYMPRIVKFAQARELLVRVKESGRRIALATSSDKGDLAIYKKIVGMEDLVEEEATSADARASKPAPDIFAAALQKVGAGPEEAIALGDTPYDAQAAGQLGIKLIGLTCGGWKRGDLLEAGCAEVYQDPADLLLRFAESLLGSER